MMDNSLDIRANDALELSLEQAHDIITRDYLFQLSQYEVKELPDNLKGIDISEHVRLYHFTKLVSDKNENMLDKLVTVLNAAYTSNASVITIIQGQAQRTDYYLGIVSKDPTQETYDAGTQGETFYGALTGNFPGLCVESLNATEIKKLCDRAFVYNYVTSISGIASLRNEKEKNLEKYVQGIEHIVDSMQGREYCIVVIADPVKPEELSITRLGYESLYSQLTPYLKTTLGYNVSDSTAFSSNESESITDTISNSTSLTQNHSQTSGWSTSTSTSESTSKDPGRTVGGLITGALGVAATIATGGIAAPLLGAASLAGGLASNALSGVIGTKTSGKSQSDTKSGSTTDSEGETKTEGSSQSSQHSTSKGQTDTSTNGRSLQFETENRIIKDMLTNIERNIERLDKCESFGAFSCASYVISSDPETNNIVSNGYNALLRGDSSSLQASYINSWFEDDPNNRKIHQYLRHFSHPLFQKSGSDILVTPASLMNSCELAVNLGMPKKSINGLPVYESAAFGRNVYFGSGKNIVGKNISMGHIYHMGAEESTKVELDVKSLAMHTFVTGSTGSGKSNTVYQMLRELNRQKIKFLVIEPAKGEYKHVFGMKDAKVYGSNPEFTPLLKLNPFRFPAGIHVLEHIDRLVEIFNVCWPMYAAMPAVLKDSVERAYISAGWDLENSENAYSDRLFPTFADVLTELNIVVSESAFSQEVKDNYIGSLATRIKSLTNGIYSRIFSGKELSDRELFDENAIIDLSRIGSVETKSMIMGILVMRLQEYRMTSGGMNSPLRHVTVLEEAHNLLKRTSTEQSSESSNLVGKSVEMLSNAIAEVRTYGEGFIIADQAPGLLDMSVIRNTNTKIIMRLPDASDRELVGKSANLSDDQIKELAKLPTGVAAIYQNNWLEPVLCKVDYQHSEAEYVNKIQAKANDYKHILLKYLIKKVNAEQFDLNMYELSEIVLSAELRSTTKINLMNIFKRNGRVSIKDISGVAYDLIWNTQMEQLCKDSESVEEWHNAFVMFENSGLINFSTNEQNILIEGVLEEQIRRHEAPDEFMDIWKAHTQEGIL